MTDEAAGPSRVRKRWRPARVAVPIEPGRPFVRVDFDATAETSWALRSRYRRVFRGVYLPKEIDATPLLKAEAALLLAGHGCYISHHTAAILWGGSVPNDPDVHVTFRGPRGRCFGIAAHRPKTEQQVGSWRGPRIDHCRADLPRSGPGPVAGGPRRAGRLIGEEEALPPGGAGGVRRWCNWPPSSRAKRAAGLVRAGVDSPMETRLGCSSSLPDCRSRLWTIGFTRRAAPLRRSTLLPPTA